VVNGIQDFRSIRFMRLYDERAGPRRRCCALRALEFVRGEWRKYTCKASRHRAKVIGGDPDQTTHFNVAAVNIEENGNRTPINYVLAAGHQPRDRREPAPTCAT
jgi:cell surface protein SprA